jgi:hypothetical protein
MPTNGHALSPMSRTAGNARLDRKAEFDLGPPSVIAYSAQESTSSSPAVRKVAGFLFSTHGTGSITARWVRGRLAPGTTICASVRPPRAGQEPRWPDAAGLFFRPTGNS